jgi:hypothetical protein
MTPRPNLRLIHPLDRYHFARYERRTAPRRLAPRVDWLKLLVWTLGIGLGLLTYYAGLLLILWCCT